MNIFKLYSRQLQSNYGEKRKFQILTNISIKILKKYKKCRCKKRLSYTSYVKEIHYITYICIKVIDSRCNSGGQRYQCLKGNNNMEDLFVRQVVEGGRLKMKQIQLIIDRLSKLSWIGRGTDKENFNVVMYLLIFFCNRKSKNR